MRLEDLAPVYTDELVRHLVDFPKQTTTPSSAFLESCADFQSGLISQEKLTSVAVRIGFKDVVTAFQNLKGGPITQPFYSDDLRSSGNLILHDDLLCLSEGHTIGDLRSETESRWRLVETAWSLGVSERILTVDSDDSFLVLTSSEGRRANITSSREALNGYQKGSCFYCFREISTLPHSTVLGEVDHFLPHSAQDLLPGANIDGVWNLVLACRQCNGPGEKWDRLPHVSFLSRLHSRNEFLIQSKHPLRESLINQTGTTNKQRAKTLQERYNSVAMGMAIPSSSSWTIAPVNPPQF